MRKFTKKWNAVAALLTPASLSAVAYPSPAILTWSAVPGAATYRVSVATGAAGGGVDAPGGIISNGALAWSNGGNPIETSNTNLAVSAALHPGTYYWQVVPVDAEGHAGTPSAIFSFAWIWAGTTTPSVSDMVPGVEIYDPLFQWAPIPGAASYQIEINTTSGFATGSKLSRRNTSATSFAPTQTLPNNTYYWRVRGVDPQGQAGPGTTARPSTRPTIKRPCPDRPTCRSGLEARSRSPSTATSTSRSSPGTRSPARACTRCRLPARAARRSTSTANTAWTPFADTGNSAVPQIFAQPSANFETGSAAPHR